MEPVPTFSFFQYVQHWRSFAINFVIGSQAISFDTEYKPASTGNNWNILVVVNIALLDLLAGVSSTRSVDIASFVARVTCVVFILDRGEGCGWRAQINSRTSAKRSCVSGCAKLIDIQVTSSEF